MNTLYIAQVNIGRIKAAPEDPIMVGFMTRLDEINAIADGSPGFVWRLQTSEGNATDLRPYDDDRILVNMSVWESIEQLKHFVYKTTHAELLRQRQDWFEKFAGSYTTLWWIPKGHIPSVDEAKIRLAHLETHGPAQFAFTFKNLFPADEQFVNDTDWSSFTTTPI